MTTPGEPETYLTDELMAMIGVETEMSELSEPILPEQVRRFAQATMDTDRAYWDEEYARSSKYNGLVCPPLMGGGSRRPLGSEDPFDWFATNPDWDGSVAGAPPEPETPGSRRLHLPQLNIPLVRNLNAGVESEFFQYLRPGDRIKSKSRYASIVERQGRESKMLIVTTENIVYNQNDEIVRITRNSGIRR